MDVQKYSLEVDIFSCFVTPYPRSFSAIQRITLSAVTPLQEIKLNAVNSSLTIDSVSLPATSFHHDQDTLRIFLESPVEPGDFVDITIWYRHKNVNDQGFYASYGTVFTDSPPEGARKWMPCHDVPNDKVTWELKARVKSPAMLCSTGLEASAPVLAGDTIIYHWKSDLPVSTYLIAFSGKINFQLHQKTYPRLANPNDTIPVLIYHKPGENIALIDSMITPLTSFYEQLFGAYPFEKIGFATMNPQFAWGGMENQTLVHLRPNGYSDLDLIAHEHAHQWFGDLITCGTWADIWLNEGFGTYCQNLWVEHHEGAEAYRQSMNGLANYYLTANTGKPLYNPAWAGQTPSSNELYNVAMTYNKGACVLAQLRYVLGDSLFFSCLRNYIDHPDLRFGNATTSDFVRIVSETAQEDLSWYFDSWVFGPNHPVYENTIQFDSLAANSWKVTIQTAQVQDQAGFFRMPLEFLFRFTSGNDTLIRFFNEENNQFTSFTFNRKPSEVVFDPDRNILMKQASMVLDIHDLQSGTDLFLHQNEPNPFSGSTLIKYHVPGKTSVVISVLDSKGKIVDVPVNKLHDAGTYRFSLSNPGWNEGVYFLVMKAGKVQLTRRMIIFN